MWAELERLSRHVPVAARPALIAVAHGSRDPRSAATMSAVVADIAAARPDLDVRLAFLDLNTPSVEQIVDAVAAQGHTHAVVAPLLLGNAFHARVDLPELLATAGARHPQLLLTQADVLGPDPRLIAALRDRISETLAAQPDSPSTQACTEFCTAADLGETTHAHADRIGIAVAAVGSSSPAANARTAEVARRLSAITGWHTEICFATTEPTVTEAISRLRARGATEILIAPWFLAPGLLTDRLAAAAPNHPHTPVIGPHPTLTEIVLARYDTAVNTLLPLSA
ncbi:sirohydrochlorin chelatase [Nocardia sp. NPDC052566]|uniref:sirohydrochlorin chelatase n=1 Tax=Nocardia sp. NPDC052566 TaxID=3364330 RepID=UPI0037C7F50C